MSGRDYVHAVRMENVHMAFGNVVALKEVDLAVGANEIVGLIGDNGAGKSTLIKIVTGVLTPTAGRLYIRDRLVDPERYSVRRAHDLRIEAVHQEKSLADKQPLVAQPVRRPPDHQPLGLHRRPPPEADRQPHPARADRLSQRRDRRRVRRSATSPAASARASRSAARCTSTPT